MKSIWVAALMTVVSCTSAPIVGKKDLLGFLQVGQTTRQEVYLNLGDPNAQYEEGARIVTYRIGEDEGGYFVREGLAMADWTGVRYSLVLAFDDTGVVRKYSLVQVRSP